MPKDSPESKPAEALNLRQFSVKEVKDLYGLREALELYAVEVAELTPKLIIGLKQSTQRTKKLLRAGDQVGHIEEDAIFHGLIASATGNTELMRILANI